MSFVVVGNARAAPGDLDESFSGDGVLELPAQDVVAEVAAAADGSVLVVATPPFSDTRAADIIVTRTLPNGEFDAAFSGDGALSLDLGKHGWVGELIAEPSGSFLIDAEVDSQPLLIRIDREGELDPSLDGDGILTLTPTLAVVTDIALQDERILAVGANADFGDVVIRLLSDGSLDHSFGENGKGELPYISGSTSVAVDPDGSIVIGAAQLVKLESDGTVDATFAGDGVLELGRSAGSPSMIVQPDGHIVLALTTCIFFGPDAGDCRNSAQRVTPDGLSHSSLGGGGWLGSAPGDGIYLAGAQLLEPYPTTFTLKRFSPAGVLDESFGRRGYAIAYLGLQPAEAIDLTVLPDGRPIVAARLEDGPSGALMRFEIAPGPVDRDADLVYGREDRCPLGHSPTPRGCASIDTRVRLGSPIGRRLEVKVASTSVACVVRPSVRIYRKRPGRDRLLTIRHSDRFGVKADADGRYYASVRRSFTAIARCQGARSATVELGNRG